MGQSNVILSPSVVPGVYSPVARLSHCTARHSHLAPAQDDLVYRNPELRSCHFSHEISHWQDRAKSWSASSEILSESCGSNLARLGTSCHMPMEMLQVRGPFVRDFADSGILQDLALTRSISHRARTGLRLMEASTEMFRRPLLRFSNNHNF